jgi:RNA-splicing ligase RtcB
MKSKIGGSKLMTHYTIQGKYTSALLTVDNLEQECISQVYQATNHPAFTNPIAIMPDAHAGKGNVVGFTVKVGEKVIPNTVGVDIGCGMTGVKLTIKDLQDSLENIDKTIRATVPTGFSVREKAPREDFYERFFSPSKLQLLAEQMGISNIPAFDKRYFDQRIFKINKRKPKEAKRRIYHSLGTLGGGNHFIELGRDTNDHIWIIIHSGSRQFGLQVCNHHQDKAYKSFKLRREHTFESTFKQRKKETDQSQWEQLKQEVRAELKIDEQFPKGMEYLEGNDVDQYLLDMILAQEYAYINRLFICGEVLKTLGIYGEIRKHTVRHISTVHNYIDPERRMIRKGACSAELGEAFILPFNMRDGTLICKGKGNPDWNYSAPHGAGRIMSRSEAKKQLSLESFKQEMTGIYSSSVCEGTLDEAPGAYKDPEMIQKAISPTAKIVDRITPFLNIKAM